MPDETEQPERDPLALAFKAGASVATEPPERSHLGANPFPEGTDEHNEWLRGFRTVLERAVENDPRALLHEINEKIGVEESVNG